jgi:hypothetical protein
MPNVQLLDHDMMRRLWHIYLIARIDDDTVGDA